MDDAPSLGDIEGSPHAQSATRPASRGDDKVPEAEKHAAQQASLGSHQEVMQAPSVVLSDDERLPGGVSLESAQQISHSALSATGLRSPMACSFLSPRSGAFGSTTPGGAVTSQPLSYSLTVKANVQRAAVLSPERVARFSPESRSMTPSEREGDGVGSEMSPPRAETLSSSSTTSFSKERAEENFKKAKAAIREQFEKAAQRAHDQHPLDSREEGTCNTTAAGAGVDASMQLALSITSSNNNSDAGDRLYHVIQSVMQAADSADDDGKHDDGVDDNTGHKMEDGDWRDDDDTIVAPSAFFQSPTSLETSNNRIMEAIIARGHAAQTDAELRWLYRQSYLLSLLDPEELDVVVSSSLRREYSKGGMILPLHTKLHHLYAVVWGEVEVFKLSSLHPEEKALERAYRLVQHMKTAGVTIRGSPMGGGSAPHTYKDTELVLKDQESSEKDEGALYTHVATLLPGQVFGTESFVFDEDSKYLFRAGGKTRKTVVSLIPFAHLRNALARNARFSQGVGAVIAGSVEIFGPIREFCRYVFSSNAAQNEYLPLWSIVESYTKINNVIHTKIFSKELDTGAWGYAVNRLPENVTSTFCFDLVHSLPPFVASRMQVEARAADVRKNAAAEHRSHGSGSSRTSITYIRTKERRRCTWHLGMEGKTLVLLRDGFTDLLDFLTMLCLHIIESNKLRGRVQGMVHPPAIDILDDYLRERDREMQESVVTSAEEEMGRIKRVLQRMPLTSEERAGLIRNWGDKTLLRVYEVMMHREEYNVRIDPSISRKFQTNPFHEWALNLRACVLAKIGLDPTSALPHDLYIDVVSSNTHCIKNLLCSFSRKYRKEIVDYAVQYEQKKLGNATEWHNMDDMLYSSLTNFLHNYRPDLKEEFTKTLELNGITVLQDTAMTGLQVDVIPVHSLNLDTIDDTIRASLRQVYEHKILNPAMPTSAGTTAAAPSATTGCAAKLLDAQQQLSWARVSDPAVAWSLDHSSPPGSRRVSTATKPTTATAAAFSPNKKTVPHMASSFRLPRHFIINMDFAFGAQAEGICRAVFSAFGRCIRSVSVMGKAGGLTGKRGDIQLASHVLLSKSSLILEDNQDELRNCRNQDITSERLQELAGPAVHVHHGKVLTVTGTILQNVPLLQYYKRVWRCVGTEMEGSYFARVIEDFYRQGIAHPDLITRFAYYTSDLPLGHSERDEAEEKEVEGTSSVGGPAAATLSAPMTPMEGVPPLYAIARGILEKVLLP